jgi:hypothetical protein
VFESRRRLQSLQPLTALFGDFHQLTFGEIFGRPVPRTPPEVPHSRRAAVAVRRDGQLQRRRLVDDPRRDRHRARPRRSKPRLRTPHATPAVNALRSFSNGESEARRASRYVSVTASRWSCTTAQENSATDPRGVCRARGALGRRVSARRADGALRRSVSTCIPLGLCRCT